MTIRLKQDPNKNTPLTKIMETFQNTFSNKLYNLFAFGIYSFSFYKHSPETIISYIQDQFYELKIAELQKAIMSLDVKLKGYHFNANMQSYTEDSMKLFKAYLFKKYRHSSHRTIFDQDVLWKNFGKFIAAYPVILSTTHSLRNSAAKNYLFDYVLIDEASQVDIVTGTLALSCAKNAVIVGDEKQLPHVVEDEISRLTTAIFNSYNLNEAYHYTNHSLLTSFTSLFKNVPRTLLKEHYRCHPKIIHFCNKKFYNDELVILSEETEENNQPLIFI